MSDALGSFSHNALPPNGSLASSKGGDLHLGKMRLRKTVRYSRNQGLEAVRLGLSSGLGKLCPFPLGVERLFRVGVDSITGRQITRCLHGADIPSASP